MDTRDTAEQAELRRAARQLAHELGPATVALLVDPARRKRLASAAHESGWLELRDDQGDGAPLASGVEAAIVADALGGAVADLAFTGPVLAADLVRRAGSSNAEGRVVAFSSSLGPAAVVPGPITAEPLYAIDGGTDLPAEAYVLIPESPGYRLGLVRFDGPADGTDHGSDLTRALLTIPAGTDVVAVPDQSTVLTADDLASWTALGLALTSADLVGVMRGVLDVTVAYASDRRQYGVPIGSFQAVQHLLARPVA